MIDSTQALWLLGLTMGVVFAVKLVGWVDLTVHARATGSRGHSGTSVLVETFLSALLAPVLMVIQTGLVVSILSGRDSGLEAQAAVSGAAVGRASPRPPHPHRHRRRLCRRRLRRRSVPPGLAVSCHRQPDPGGPDRRRLCLAPPGTWLKRRGLLMIPEEVRVPRSVRRPPCSAAATSA